MNNMEIVVKNIISKNIYKDVLTLPLERKNYKNEENIIIIPTFFYRIIGIEHKSEDEYKNELYYMDKNLKESGAKYIRFEGKLNTRINKDLLSKINKIWIEISADRNIRPMYLGPNLFGAKLIKHTNSIEKDNLLKKSFAECLENFLKFNSKNINPTIVKNFCVKLIFWFNIYAFENFRCYKYERHNPKIIFFGEIKRDEAFFLIFMSKIGFDIMYINPKDDSIFSLIDREYKYGVRFEFDYKTEINEFPKEEATVSIQTNAFLAENYIENVSDSEKYNIIRPWQFKDYLVNAIPLKTGLEELFSIWNLESRERNGFKIYDKKIYIPNILVKINGTYNNTETYWNKMLELLKVKDGFILLIDMFPISKPKEEKIDYKGLINKNGYINIEKMRKSSFYNLSFLKTSLQENILLKINEIIDKKILIYGNDYNFKIKIIKTIFSLDKKILNLLQIFDYPFYIPKIVIYDNTEKILSEEDCITIVILHSLGIDIALITPSGYNNIENYVNKNFIDFQNLEKLKFDLNYSKKVKKYLTNSKLIVKKTLSYHLKEYFKKYN